jgi:hypothetical protein
MWRYSLLAGIPRAWTKAGRMSPTSGCSPAATKWSSTCTEADEEEEEEEEDRRMMSPASTTLDGLTSTTGGLTTCLGGLRRGVDVEGPVEGPAEGPAAAAATRGTTGPHTLSTIGGARREGLATGATTAEATTATALLMEGEATGDTRSTVSTPAPTLTRGSTTTSGARGALTEGGTSAKSSGGGTRAEEEEEERERELRLRTEETRRWLEGEERCPLPTEDEEGESSPLSLVDVGDGGSSFLEETGSEDMVLVVVVGVSWMMVSKRMT